MNSMQIGGFVSAAGGVDKAVERAEAEGFEVTMFFIGSPHSWNLPKLTKEDGEKIRAAQKSSRVKTLYSHALYLVNLATPEAALFEKSVKALSQTMQNGEQFGLRGVIFHLGSHKGTSSKAGLDRVADGMQKVLDASPGETLLIMENSVGQGDKVGVGFAELGYVFKKLNHPRVKICMDTCHTFATGYNYAEPTSLKKLISDIDTNIGFENLVCLHVNDSQGELGSNVDRHANIGEGHVGKAGFHTLFNTPQFASKDLILEIPGIDNNGPSAKDLKVLQDCLN